MRLDPKGTVNLPGVLIPGFRTQLAIDAGVERRLLFKTWGGIGDQICAEPTLRYAQKNFKDCEFFLYSELPELFQHLNWKRVFDARQEMPNVNSFLSFETITPPNDSNLVWQFFSHMLVNCVDFPSLCALRLQLPVADKPIILQPTAPVDEGLRNEVRGGVFVHAGRHWQSKTFPVEFWNRVLAGLKVRGIRPILIGGDADDNRGTVAVDATGCLDLRNKLSINDSIWCLKQARVLLTNDSAPMHMAAAGHAWIGFVATCKHPDMITHWRRPYPSADPTVPREELRQRRHLGRH
jgi:ADP-heptose:LPS heptosyltransferase